MIYEQSFPEMVDFLYDLPEKNVHYQGENARFDKNGESLQVSSYNEHHEELTKRWGRGTYLVKGISSNEICYYELLLQKKKEEHECDILLCFSFDPELMDIGLQSFFIPVSKNQRFDITEKEIEEYKESLEDVGSYVMNHIIQQDPTCRLYFATNEVTKVLYGYFPKIKEERSQDGDWF